MRRMPLWLAQGCPDVFWKGLASLGDACKVLRWSYDHADDDYNLQLSVLARMVMVPGRANVVKNPGSNFIAYLDTWEVLAA